MPPERRSADDPIEWLDRARNNLEMAKVGTSLHIAYLEDPCFEAQQAAEKAIKAVLLHLGARFPYIHDLADLLNLVEKAGKAVPKAVKDAGRLTRFALVTRYPGVAEPVTRQEYKRAIKIAERIVAWAERSISRKRR